MKLVLSFSYLVFKWVLKISIILIISCGPKNSKSTEEILATNDYALIQNSHHQMFHHI